MGFSFGDKGNLKVILSQDSAVHCTPTEYESYLKDLDETQLHLEGNPTRWLLKKTLDYAAHQKILNMQASLGRKGQVSFNLSYIMEEVRIALIGVENPPEAPDEIPYLKDGDGYCNKEIIASLHSAGCLFDLHNAYKNASSGTTQGDTEVKKS